MSRQPTDWNKLFVRHLIGKYPIYEFFSFEMRLLTSVSFYLKDTRLYPEAEWKWENINVHTYIFTPVKTW